MEGIDIKDLREVNITIFLPAAFIKGCRHKVQESFQDDQSVC